MTWIGDSAAGSTRGTPPVSIDVATLLCLVAGDTLWGFVLASRLSPLGLSPLFWLGAALLVVRHSIWPRPSLVSRLRGAMVGGLPGRAAAVLLLLVVLTRAGVLIVGGIASTSASDPARLERFPRLSSDPVQNLPARWDAFWYLGIAREGYAWRPDRRDRQQNVAFFPGYPFLMRVAGDVVTVPAKVLRDPELFGSGAVRVLWGGALASVVCFALALTRLFELERDSTDEAASAVRACVLLAAYPFAVFFSLPYSESLALLALVSLVLAWRSGDLRWGIFWGLVLGLTRSNGWTVAAALVADRALGAAPAWKGRTGWLFVAMAPVAGAVAYSAYLYMLTGHPLEWITAQHAWGGGMQPALFFSRRVSVMQAQGLSGYLSADPVDALTMVAVVAMIAIAGWLAVRRMWLYAALMVAYLAPAIAIDLPASGRMTSLLFPAFIVLGRGVRGVAFVLVACAFLALQGWFAWRFFLWNTPY